MLLCTLSPLYVLSSSTLGESSFVLRVVTHDSCTVQSIASYVTSS